MLAYFEIFKANIQKNEKIKKHLMLATKRLSSGLIIRLDLPLIHVQVPIKPEEFNAGVYTFYYLKLTCKITG